MHECACAMPLLTPRRPLMRVLFGAVDRHYPAIQEFIENKAPGVKNLKLTYTQGAPPTLFMQDESGVTREEVAINSWKTEHIEEYLAEKLA